MEALLLTCSVLFLAASGNAEHNVRVEDPQAFRADTRIMVGEVANKTGESFDIEDMLIEALINELQKESSLGQQDENQHRKLRVLTDHNTY